MKQNWGASKEEDVVITTTTTKRRGKRQLRPKNLPCEIVVLELDEHDKQCPFICIRSTKSVKIALKSGYSRLRY